MGEGGKTNRVCEEGVKSGCRDELLRELRLLPRLRLDEVEVGESRADDNDFWDWEDEEVECDMSFRGGGAGLRETVR